MSCQVGGQYERDSCLIYTRMGYGQSQNSCRCGGATFVVKANRDKKTSAITIVCTKAKASNGADPLVHLLKVNKVDHERGCYTLLVLFKVVVGL